MKATEVFLAIISIMNKIQRKFLVSADIERWLKKQTFSIEKLERFYIQSDGDTECYYLKSYPHTYMKVIIEKEGKENVYPVTEEIYVSKCKNVLGKKVVKETYTVTVNEETFVVSKYLKKLEGLYIIVAYFKDEKAMRNSKVIQSLQPFILKEIDKDEKYNDRSLSLYEKPMEYNLEKLFTNIDAFEAANLFFWQVPKHLYVRDGVSLVLYRNIRLLNYYKMSFQKKHFSSTLHRLRVLLHRTATLLETFSDLFSPNVQRFCIDLLQRFYEETKALRYLYFLNELCATREDAKLTLYSELKSLISQEEKAVMEMLLSQSFTQMINIITREIEVQENQKYISLKREVKNVVIECLGRLEILLGETKEGYDDEVLEALYIFIDSLQTLIEDFFHIIGEKESKIIIEELNILFKPLREYRNCKEREVILNSIKVESETKTLDITPLLCEHEEILKDKIEHALKLLRTSRFYV